MDMVSPYAPGFALWNSTAQVIAEYNHLDLIMHPVFKQLLNVKWDLFGEMSHFFSTFNDEGIKYLKKDFYGHIEPPQVLFVTA